MTFPKSRRFILCEADILRQCQDLLSARRIFHFRVNTTGVRRRDRQGREFWAFNGSRGVPDLLAVLPRHSCKAGVLLAIECKRPGAKQTEEQIAFQCNLTAAGGEYAVIDDVVKLDELLTDLGV